MPSPCHDKGRHNNLGELTPKSRILKRVKKGLAIKQFSDTDPKENHRIRISGKKVQSPKTPSKENTSARRHTENWYVAKGDNLAKKKKLFPDR